MIVTIDGPAGAGKSTVAKLLARSIGFQYMDSGALYRCYAYQAWLTGANLDTCLDLEKFVRNTSIDADFHQAHPRLWVNGQEVSDEIRSNLVSGLVSKVSKIGTVREAVVQKLRDLAETGDFVIDGRDIGTVVFPDAEVKIYLTASLQARAQRRLADYLKQGESIDLESLKEQIARRDFEDSTRDLAPLKKPEDAVEIDTTEMTTDSVIEKMSALITSYGENLHKIHKTGVDFK